MSIEAAFSSSAYSMFEVSRRLIVYSWCCRGWEQVNGSHRGCQRVE